MKPSIVFVACDPFLAGIYGRKFERDGWDVEVIETVDEAEKKAVQMRPNIFLFDASCVADVSEEVRRLRSLPTLLKTKIVILAEEGERGIIERSMNAGAAAYLLTGHFVPQEAVQKMRALLDA